MLSPVGAALIGIKVGDRMPYLSIEGAFHFVIAVSINPPIKIVPFAQRAPQVRTNVEDDPFDPDLKLLSGVIMTSLTLTASHHADHCGSRAPGTAGKCRRALLSAHCGLSGPGDRTSTDCRSGKRERRPCDDGIVCRIFATMLPDNVAASCWYIQTKPRSPPDGFPS